jgi:low affinity Fe/Cu permease
MKEATVPVDASPEADARKRLSAQNGSPAISQEIGRVFSRLAQWSADAMGSATAFVVATAACLIWAVSGPFFNYSDTWQLVVNTATTVLTFLAVFLIQHTQNKEGKALQLKLDELIRATHSARNRLIDLEHCTEEELRQLQDEFARRRLEPLAPAPKDET